MSIHLSQTTLAIILALLGIGVGLMFPNKLWLGFVLIVLAIYIFIIFGIDREEQSLTSIGKIPILWLIVSSLFFIAGAIGVWHGANLAWPPIKKELKALSDAQLKELQEINDFIGKKDENELRETFDFYNIFNFNIKLARRGLAPKLVTHEESIEIDKFFEGGQARIDARYVNITGKTAAHVDLIPGKIGIINISKKYVESRRLLAHFCSSALLPVEVVRALKDFDKAIEDNSVLMIEVLNERLADNVENIIENANSSSPLFGNTSHLYLSRFIQLRPKAEAINAAIRAYLEVK